MGGRSLSVTVRTWGWGLRLQTVTSRGSASGPLSFTSSRVRSRVPVPVVGGKPAGRSDDGGGIPKTGTLMRTGVPRVGVGTGSPRHCSLPKPGCGSW